MNKYYKELKEVFKQSFTIEELKIYSPLFTEKGQGIIKQIIKEKDLVRFKEITQ